MSAGLHLGPAEVETAPGVDLETKTKDELAPPWHVIVHDDPVTLMVYVTHVFMRVFGYAFERAQGLMLEVHTRGRAIVWTGDRERAEQYVQTLHGYHLLATLDPAPAG